MTAGVDELRGLIRPVPDFPRPGILFQDVMPLLADAGGFARCIDALAAPWREAGVGFVLAIEARGFLFGSALARVLGAGLVPLRKRGKLPGALAARDYALEYGEERLEMQLGVLPRGGRAILVDDVLATGGTLRAADALARGAGLEVLGSSVVLEILGLDGRAGWPGPGPLHALLAV